MNTLPARFLPLFVLSVLLAAPAHSDETTPQPPLTESIRHDASAAGQAIRTGVQHVGKSIHQTAGEIGVAVRQGVHTVGQGISHTLENVSDSVHRTFQREDPPAPVESPQ